MLPNTPEVRKLAEQIQQEVRHFLQYGAGNLMRLPVCAESLICINSALAHHFQTTGIKATFGDPDLSGRVNLNVDISDDYVISRFNKENPYKLSTIAENQEDVAMIADKLITDYADINYIRSKIEEAQATPTTLNSVDAEADRISGIAKQPAYGPIKEKPNLPDWMTTF